MKFRTGVVVGFAAGYVLGARAGRERYEQIRTAFESFRANEHVQRATAKGKAIADQSTARARGAMSEGLHQVSDVIRDRTQNS